MAFSDARRLLLSSLRGPGALANPAPIRFIVGGPAGGAIDPYARMIAEHMAKTLGQPIIVENKPGASGNSRRNTSSTAPADGNMIWLGTQALHRDHCRTCSAISRWSIDDFHPIIRACEAPLVFVVHPSVPANTFAEFVDLGEGEPGKLSYSSYQAGTPSHFLGFQMNEKFDLDLTHVPYRGSGAQANGLLAGHSLFGFSQVNSSLPQVRAGTLKALAMTGATRDHSMPDVPTFAELGHPEFTARVWFGLLVKAGTPPDVVRSPDRRRQGRACRPEDPQEARSPGLRGGRGNRTAAPDQDQGAVGALGPPGEGVRLLCRRPRQHAVAHDPGKWIPVFGQDHAQTKRKPDHDPFD